MQDGTPSLCAPDRFVVSAKTTAGTFALEVIRAWAPRGADRFFELLQHRYYDDSRFFRVVPNKWAQFGIAGTPSVAQAWRHCTIPDDPILQSNTRGFVAFANTGPGTRSSQIFINLGNNSAQNDIETGFAPFGRVASGMATVDGLYGGYGETSGGGMRAGRQDPMFTAGNAFLDTHFPKLDRLIRLAIEPAS